MGRPTQEDIDELVLSRSVRVNKDAIKRQEETNEKIILFLENEIKRAQERCKHRMYYRLPSDTNTCPTCDKIMENQP